MRLDSCLAGNEHEPFDQRDHTLAAITLSPRSQFPRTVESTDFAIDESGGYAHPAFDTPRLHRRPTQSVSLSERRKAVRDDIDPEGALAGMIASVDSLHPNGVPTSV